MAFDVLRWRRSVEEGADDLRVAAAKAVADALFEDREVGRALASQSALFHPSQEFLRPTVPPDSNVLVYLCRYL